jgi:hypothetical protein
MSEIDEYLRTHCKWVLQVETLKREAEKRLKENKKEEHNEHKRK